MIGRASLDRRMPEGDSGSVVLALLSSLIVGSLVLVITATAIGGQKVVRFDRDFSAVIAAADAGVQEALHRLNVGRDPISPMPALASAQPDCVAPLPTTQKCITGTLGEATYQWYAVKVAGREWDVFSSGERNGRVRSVVARLLENREFFASAFADTQINFAGGTIADSYSSGAPGPAAYTPRPGRLGIVGSNGNLDIPNNNILDSVQLWNFAPTPVGYAGPAPAPSDNLALRCPQSPRIGLTVPTLNYSALSYNPALAPGATDPPENLNACSNSANLRPSSGSAYQERIAERRVMSPSLGEMDARRNACIAAAGSYTSIPVFSGITSLAPVTNLPVPGRVTVPPSLTATGDTVPGYYCFRSVTFSNDFTVSGGASATNPVVITSMGDVSIPGGPVTRVNCSDCDGDGDARPTAAALRIYMAPPPSGPVGTFDSQTHNYMSFALTAPLSLCKGGSQNEVYGSLICKTINNTGSWKFHYDVALAAIGNNTFTVSRYEERQ